MIIKVLSTAAAVVPSFRGGCDEEEERTDFIFSKCVESFR